MSDPNVKIRIDTEANAKPIVLLEQELADLIKQMKALPVGSEAFNAMAGRVKAAQTALTGARAESEKLTGVVGRKGNAGMAVLEFSRAFEDLQYGIRGVMNNIPGLLAQLGAGAGLAGVVSIAAVGVSLLWETFGETEKPKKAADEIDKVKESLKKLKELLDDVKRFYADLNTEDTVEKWEREKEAIDDQAEAMQHSNEMFAENIRHRERMVQLLAQAKLREIDAAEKAGRITPQAADAARQQVGTGKDAETLRIREEAQQQELAKVVKQLEIAKTADDGLKLALTAAKLEYDARKAQLDEAKLQLTLRRGLDAEIKAAEAALPQRKREAEEAAAKAASLEQLGQTEAAAKFRYQAGLLQKEADLLAETIRQGRERIAREALPATDAADRRVKQLETGTDAKGNPVGLPFKDLEQNFSTLDEKAKDASEAVGDLAQKVTTAAERIAGTINNARAEARVENPALPQQPSLTAQQAIRDAQRLAREQAEADTVRQLMDEIAKANPSAAKNPLFQGALAKLADGLQPAEAPQVEAILSKIAAGNEATKGLLERIGGIGDSFVQIATATNTNQAGLVTAVAGVAGMTRANASSIDELKRSVQGLQQAAKNPVK